MDKKLTEKQQQRVENNINLIHHILKKYPYAQRSYDDYFQAGAIGLCKAAQRYNGDKGVAFSTFAYMYILGYIKMQYSEFEHGLIKLPRGVLYSDDKQDKKPTFVYIDGLKNNSKKNGIDEEFNAIDLFIQSNDFSKDSITNIEIEKFKKSLDYRELIIFEMKSVGHNQKDIGKVLGLTQARVCVLKKKLEEKLYKELGLNI